MPVTSEQRANSPALTMLYIHLNVPAIPEKVTGAEDIADSVRRKRKFKQTQNEGQAADTCCVIGHGQRDSRFCQNNFETELKSYEGFAIQTSRNDPECCSCMKMQLRKDMYKVCDPVCREMKINLFLHGREEIQEVDSK